MKSKNGLNGYQWIRNNERGTTIAFRQYCVVHFSRYCESTGKLTYVLRPMQYSKFRDHLFHIYCAVYKETFHKIIIDYCKCLTSKNSAIWKKRFSPIYTENTSVWSTKFLKLPGITGVQHTYSGCSTLRSSQDIS
ncbi:hypothetical protein T12_7577 [Trichinella patagoniensis]|uniref:Uncharacterized protein n=1 Tax=Trichinella patagoniensis TaxID=990121 RepID=A0A0V0ZUP1_9BILA|nr:hypothetical protein T12_7577 [Trichinella patagoniensis]